jgi:glycosyltransferase involved in cell wall biosynthesis
VRQAQSSQKVAIVHDWLYGGGAERVVAELHKMYPEAPIYASYCSDEWRQRLDNKVITGYLQHWPFNKLRKFLPVLRMRWFAGLDFTGYDLVISSSGNGEAMSVRVPKGTVHISYCHTPTHYYWRHYEQYLAEPGFGFFDPLARLGLKLLVRPLRRWDYQAAQRPDVILANSTGIQADIRRYYHRDSTVVFPPVDVARFASAPLKGKREGFVTAGRLVPMKRFDLIVQAATSANLPLKVIGRGPELTRLQSIAGPTVQFLTNVSDAQMPGEVASAKAFLFASHEDFGITPVEAMAAGTPVIAYRAGGALDYVVPGKTGMFFNEQTAASLSKALASFSPHDYDHVVVRQAAKAFAPEVFASAMRAIIAKNCQ